MAPSKLSPQERLNRKRNAARLRQQRCRARKRQALLERAAGRASPPKTPPPMKEPTSPPRASLPPRKFWKSRVIGPFIPKLECSSSDECVKLLPRTVSFDCDSLSRSCTSSFDSISSMDESDRGTPSPIPAPVKIDRKLSNDEEETAVAAMLSLKTVPKRLALIRPVPTIIRAPVVYANCWNPMIYQERPRIMPIMYRNHVA